MPGRPTYLDYSRARANCACSRCGWGSFGPFFSLYPFSPLSPSLWETARYRLKYCLKGPLGGGRVVRWCWVNFQCRGVLLIWKRVGQGPTALAMGAGGGSLDIFTLVYHFSFLSPSLWETARYRLKCCLKGPLSPKQPTNQPKGR